MGSLDHVGSSRQILCQVSKTKTSSDFFPFVVRKLVERCWQSRPREGSWRASIVTVSTRRDWGVCLVQGHLVLAMVRGGRGQGGSWARRSRGVVVETMGVTRPTGPERGET